MLHQRHCCTFVILINITKLCQFHLHGNIWKYLNFPNSNTISYLVLVKFIGKKWYISSFIFIFSCYEWNWAYLLMFKNHLYFLFCKLFYPIVSIFLFSFRHLKYFIPLFSCLHSFWREVWCDSYSCSSIGKIFFPSLATCKIFSLSLVVYIVDMEYDMWNVGYSIDFLVFILLSISELPRSMA